MHPWIHRLAIPAILGGLVAGVTHVEASAVSYSAGQYAQNFNSLPAPVDFGSDAVGSYVLDGTRYTFTSAANGVFDFASPIDSTVGTYEGSSGGLGLSSTMSGWHGGAASGARFGASRGSTTGGGVYSFGRDGNGIAPNTDRALGLLVSNGSGNAYAGLALTNNAGHALTSIDLGFTRELWRQGTRTPTQVVSFGYTVDPTNSLTLIDAATSGSYQQLGSLTAAAVTQTVVLDGADLANQSAIQTGSQTLATPWLPGATLWLTWKTTVVASNGHGIGIDDLTFSAVPEPTTLGAMGIAAGVLLRRRRSA